MKYTSGKSTRNAQHRNMDNHFPPLHSSNPEKDQLSSMPNIKGYDNIRVILGLVFIVSKKSEEKNVTSWNESSIPGRGLEDVLPSSHTLLHPLLSLTMWLTLKGFIQVSILLRG